MIILFYLSFLIIAIVCNRWNSTPIANWCWNTLPLVVDCLWSAQLPCILPVSFIIQFCRSAPSTKLTTKLLDHSCIRLIVNFLKRKRVQYTKWCIWPTVCADTPCIQWQLDHADWQQYSLLMRVAKSRWSYLDLRIFRVAKASNNCQTLINELLSSWKVMFECWGNIITFSWN